MLKQHSTAQQSSDSILIRNRRRWQRDILSEKQFLRILGWERKRAERSGKLFLLVLMDLGRILQPIHRSSALRELLSALSLSLRDTDIAGWYQDGLVLGLIVTDVDEPQKVVLEDVMRAKLTNMLNTKLAVALRCDQILSFYFSAEPCERPKPLANVEPPRTSLGDFALSDCKLTEELST